ncbi:BTB/POZ domain-containing protein At3g05675 [Malania oleifera]|uniref:BTB/POZ domain-containing protein At3g05675 n=1 Tax=Malania oleifera TaxID=397392 RepID=UPI0025AE8AC6|nr:BTB/POZ domain-containing protein At3g05675 [Malania oleifera]XP_057973721.1 BTB/POZ domain-containing protein At3g05675 [Malania oleifera]XP_057973728.1 BTB/POZ domain-containing protein At3g05675 [Malania oleifera]
MICSLLLIASMESHGKEMNSSSRIGDRSTSDVVVRLRTQDGRDDWLYCHSHILIEKSKYFADRLSEDWPTCQIIDSRSCVEVYCNATDFDYHVTVLRLLYVVVDDSLADMWHGVRNALNILLVAVELGCRQIITACVNYLEAVPWEEPEEEEILRVIPNMGSQVEPILARLQPVNPGSIVQIFLSAIQFATSSPPPTMHDLKSSAQEQLEYMLTEDDDAPLLTADDNIKSKVKECVRKLLERFNSLLETLLCEPTEFVSEAGKMQIFQSYLSDVSWACQILAKLEIMREFVHSWLDASEKVLRVAEQANPIEMLEVKLKVVEVAAKALEAIGYGTVILPTAKRLHMVKIWLPFIRIMKPLIDSVSANGDDVLELKIDGEVWQSLESSFVSIILALPSGDQAEILTEWLQNEHIRYPDLTEAFEVWCYRSKVAKRRLICLSDNHGMANKL